jgi:hypothetical protein
MIKLIVLSVLLNTGEVQVIIPDGTKIEARKRGKRERGRRKGGNGLR